MTEITNAYDWNGRTIIGSDGEKIGKVDELYLDRQSDQPEWARVHTGFLGTKRSFVPLAGASPKGEDVVVRVSKAQVKDAPGVDPDGELSEQEEMSSTVRALRRALHRAGHGDGPGSCRVRPATNTGMTSAARPPTTP